MITQCKVCNKEFATYPAKIKTGRGKFCSRKCYHIDQSKTRKGKYPTSLKLFHQNNPNFRKGTKLSEQHINSLRISMKKRWQNTKYRNHMRKSHRKKVSKRGNYLKVYHPTHPRADERGYVRQHWLVMEKIIGRPLNDKEIVHHIDGNRYNNKPKNLMLFKSNGYHINFHRRNKIKSFAKF